MCLSKFVICTLAVRCQELEVKNKETVPLRLSRDLIWENETKKLDLFVKYERKTTSLVLNRLSSNQLGDLKHQSLYKLCALSFI